MAYPLPMVDQPHHKGNEDEDEKRVRNLLGVAVHRWPSFAANLPPQPGVGWSAFTAASPTTANLSWGAVSQSLGYRVYQVNGTQPTLLATLVAKLTRPLPAVPTTVLTFADGNFGEPGGPLPRPWPDRGPGCTPLPGRSGRVRPRRRGRAARSRGRAG